MDLGTNAGEVTVIVPRGLNAHVAATSATPPITIGDEARDGLGESMDRTLTTSARANAPTVELTIEVRFGQITVTQG